MLWVILSITFRDYHLKDCMHVNLSVWSYINYLKFLKFITWNNVCILYFSSFEYSFCGLISKNCMYIGPSVWSYNNVMCLCVGWSHWNRSVPWYLCINFWKNTNCYWEQGQQCKFIMSFLFRHLFIATITLYHLFFFWWFIVRKYYYLQASVSLIPLFS